MSIQLKPLEDQVIVLTGASSGIGLATARMAAKRGARLVVAARSEEPLRQLVEEIRNNGGEAEYVVTDVGDFEAMKRLRDRAIERFGGFDTWINDAAMGMFGKLMDIPVEDMRKLFDTNVWGMVHGSKLAVEHFTSRQGQKFGGALINIGSVVSYQAIPLQGPYVASKHAVKGFTDSLRMELMEEKLPVSVTCIMPNSVNTPYPEHAPNYMDTEPTLPPPVYAPEVVARAILHAAQTPTRDLTVGGAFKPQTALNNVFPRLIDTVMSTFIAPAQKRQDESGYTVAASHRGLEEGTGELKERGESDRWTMPVSAYTEARMHPVAATALLAGLGILAATAVGAAVKGMDRD